MSLYESIEVANSNQHNLVLKVLDGEEIGQSALISDHELVWESEEFGFFSRHLEEVEKINDSGTLELDGVHLFCEVLAHEKKFVICGGGHVSIPIIKIGRMIGCKVTVLEDRPKFADHARSAGADRVICEPFEQGLEKIEGDADTFFIIVTRGHRYDQECLRSICRKKHAYIGMIGSRRRVAMVKQTMLDEGADPEIINNVYTPIGLNIGAETPEEIAVAIVAEIIEVKNKKQKRNSGYAQDIMDAILYDTKKEKKVLATIVARKGSAPRTTGTKMLVCPDGRCIGTIGGGCAESNILQKALMMLRTEEKIRICHVDMTGSEAEDEGMVCGGVIDVLLEMV